MVTASPNFTVGLRDATTTVGGSLTLTCEGQGQPVPQYTWYINAQPVGGWLVIARQVSITIHQVNDELSRV